MTHRRHPARRSGGVYIAVLGTAMVIALLGMSALIGQRLQNRIVVAASDIRQAQLSANTAIELAQLTMTQDADWRTTYADLDEPWFTRAVGAGTCSLSASPADSVEDPSANTALFADPSTPVKLVGTGRYGEAVQFAELVVDPRREPLQVLRAAAEAAKTGAPLTGQATTLDWGAVFSEYQSRGTKINTGSLPTPTVSVSRNMSFTDGTTAFWTGDLPTLPNFADATGLTVTSFDGRNQCLRVQRSSRLAGAANRLNAPLLKPNTDYQVSVEINPDLNAALVILLELIPAEKNGFRISLIVEYPDGTTQVVRGGGRAYSGVRDWRTITDTLRTPNWTAEPANVYLVINSDYTDGSSQTFYLDNLEVYENRPIGARFIYQKALGPGVNPFGTPNPNGIYWIDCGGRDLIIERSRILGTLLLLNPGPGSRIEYGPIHMSPVEPGYPALLVNGDFSITATSHVLGETENTNSEQGIVVNYNPDNPAAMPYDFGNSAAPSEDGDTNDIYPSEIRGLVAISGNLTYANGPRIRGPLIVGGSAVNNGGTLAIEYLPESLLNPPPGFCAPYSYVRRPSSAEKVVVP